MTAKPKKPAQKKAKRDFIIVDAMGMGKRIRRGAKALNVEISSLMRDSVHDKLKSKNL